MSDKYCGEGLNICGMLRMPESGCTSAKDYTDR